MARVAPPPPMAVDAQTSLTSSTSAERALVPILNSGLYKISNLAYGAIRDDDGALGAKGNSKSDELVWRVTRNQDSTYTLTTGDPGNQANPGGAISEIEKRYYISLEDSVVETQWRLQPILTGSNPPILFVIYQNSSDPCPGHWELNSADKKEPVKLNKDPKDEENRDVPNLYSPNALWILDPQQGPPVEPPQPKY